jgi:hypothetical protein
MVHFIIQGYYNCGAPILKLLKKHKFKYLPEDEKRKNK